MKNELKQALAEALVLANRIENNTQINEALGRALLSNQNEFNNRRTDEPVDIDESINFSGPLIELTIKNIREISLMNEDLRNKLVLIADELLPEN